MSKIINKNQKRKEIIIASLKLFSHKAIAKISMLEIAKNAEIAAGTIYLYFKNKEEIICACLDLLLEYHYNSYITRINKSMTAKEKILEFFNLNRFTSEDDTNPISILYHYFFSGLLIDLIEFDSTYFKNIFRYDYNIISACLQEGIDNNEYLPMNVDIITNRIIFFIRGMFIEIKVNKTNFIEVQKLLTLHIILVLEPYELTR